MIRTEDKIRFFYKSSKKAEPVMWIKEIVIKSEHYFTCQKFQKGPPMRVEYEPKRLDPRTTLAMDVTLQSLQENMTIYNAGISNNCI